MKQLVVALIASSYIWAATTVVAADWWENVKLQGDFRYRHEMIDKADKDARHRHRIRTRIGLFGEVSPYITIGVQLATGSDNPVSANQTLDGAFSTKRIGLDLAYFKVNHKGVPGLVIKGGKIKNPFFKPGKSELLWDSDWNPEGGMATFKRDITDVSLTMIAAGVWIDERSADDDSYLAAGQGLVRLHLNEKKSSIAIGCGFFNYVNTEGFAPFFDPDDPLGNSVVIIDENGETSLQYTGNFEILELFGEITHKVENTPITVMVDYVKNGAADSLNTGWLVGLRVGKAKKPVSWELRYIYREVEADAVIGIFTDSDFRGGGTDAKGHEIGGALQFAKNTAFKATYFINTIGLAASDTEDFKRLQLDLQLKF